MTPDANTIRAVPTTASGTFVCSAILLGFVASVLLYWPGNLSQSAVEQWYDARAATVTLHYPPLMSFVWRWLDIFVAGPGLMLVTQLGTYWIAILLVVRQLRASRIASACAIVFLAGTPLVLGLAGSILTDVLSANIALLAFAILLRYPESRHPLHVIASAFSVLALAGLVRYQMWIVAIAGLVSVLVYGHFIRKQTLRLLAQATVVSSAAFMLTVIIVQTAIWATFDVRPSFANFMLRYSRIYDIAAVLTERSTVSLKIFTERGVDINELLLRSKAEYSPYNGDFLGIRPAGKVEPGSTYELLVHLSDAEIEAEWVNVVTAAPWPFLKSRFVRLAVFFGLTNVYNCTPLDYIGFSGLPSDQWEALSGSLLKEAYAVTMLRSRLFPVRLFFQPVLYLVVSFLVIGAIYQNRRNTGSATLFRTASLLAAAYLYWLTFIPLPIACSVRYSYFSCLAIVFASVIWSISFLKARIPTQPAENTI